jgi:sugar lactone lactonase YvrE
MLAGDVLGIDAAATITRRHVGSIAAVLRPRMAGGWVLAVERGFALTGPDWTDLRNLPELWSHNRIRMNEGGCDPQGRFYCGTMAYDATPGAGKLFRLDADGTVHVVLEDVTVSNGLAWSPDGQTAYYVDTHTQRVEAFDFDGATGSFSDRRTVVSIPVEAGGPDGMTVDADGGIWVALWDGGAVHRYRPDGQLDTVIKLPTPRVTACTFGGPGLTELFITTSAIDLDRNRDPVAGSLFKTTPGVRGLPVLPFAG